MNHTVVLVALLTLIRSCVVIAQEPPVTGLCVTSSGDMLIGSQRGLEVGSWQATDDRKRLEAIDEPVHCIERSPDGRLIAVGGGMAGEWGRLWVLRRKDWAAVHVRLDHDDTIMGLDWSPDGRLLATASLDATVIIYATDTMEPIHRFKGHSRGVLAVVFVDDEQILSASRDATIRLWSVRDKQMIRTLNNHTEAVTGLARVAYDHSPLPMVVSISRDRTIRFWQPTIGRLVRFVRLADDEPLCVAQLQTSGMVKVGGSSGSLYTVDSRDASIHRQSLGSDRLISIALHPVLPDIAVGGFRSGVRIEPQANRDPSTQD